MTAGLMPGGAMAQTNSYYQGPVSDHFDGTRFFNPGVPNETRGLADMLKWKFGSRAAVWPRQVPAGPPDKPPARVAGSDGRLTFVGHASFLLQIAGLNILLDPVWSERASPFSFAGPKRHAAPGIAFDDLPRIDAVLVSHCHYDHMDLATLLRLWQRDRPRIVVPLGNDTIIRAADATVAVEAADWGDSVRLGPEVVVHLVSARHWSARGLSDRRHALWAAFVIDAPGGGIYAVGDTSFGDGSTFGAVAAAHPGLRLALLPIGAYAPRWFMKDQHVNPAEAVEAFRLCGARQAVGHHWGTFQLTDEGFDDPPRDLARALDEAGVPAQSFVTALPGTAFRLGDGGLERVAPG
ncbi:MAG: MBL fold metallo-hydrolase [Amaricoccus sp.]|uniref:MBL fold metallo-hydrolase n=1 Tax=Amaricoccus sp. TaxID=1872485 RepID=UPI0039E2D4F4